MNILVLSTYPSSDASRRIRIDPLVAALEADGHLLTTNTILTDGLFRLKNRPLLRLIGIPHLAWRLITRAIFVFTLTRDRFDAAIVHREAFPFFTPHFEEVLRRRVRCLILDVDDAIYTQPTYVKDWRRFFRDAGKADNYREIFDLIVCGNPVIEKHFSGGHAICTYSPSCPSPGVTDIIRAAVPRRALLWTGSYSTLENVSSQLGGLLDLCEEHDLDLCVLGGTNIQTLPEHPRLKSELWTVERELRLLSECKLGIMPLGGNDWENGKSGYKALLYLCSGMPSVITDVGFNQDLSQTYSMVVGAPLDDFLGTLREVLIEDTMDLVSPEEIDRARQEYNAGMHAHRISAMIADLWSCRS